MPEVNLSPSGWAGLHVGAPPVFLNGQRKDTTRQRVVRVDVAESGRRRVPSAGQRAVVADGKRGVNDPGVAWPVRPRAMVSGGRSRPAVSMSDEAREQAPSSGGFAGNGSHSFSRAGCHPRGWPDRHHVLEHARSARRRARFSATLRPRAGARGSRLSECVLTNVIFAERETLTAPRRARSVGIYVMAGGGVIWEGARDVQIQESPSSFGDSHRVPGRIRRARWPSRPAAKLLDHLDPEPHREVFSVRSSELRPQLLLVPLPQDVYVEARATSERYDILTVAIDVAAQFGKYEIVALERPQT